MRALPAIVGALAALIGLAGAYGCGQEPLPTGDDCQRAQAVFTKCGVSLPVLSSGACTGVQRMIARCVAHHATTCDDLSTLLGRIDVCAEDELDGGDLAPVSDLPIPPPAEAGADSALDAPLPSIDAASPFDAGAPDALSAARDSSSTD